MSTFQRRGLIIFFSVSLLTMAFTWAYREYRSEKSSPCTNCRGDLRCSVQQQEEIARIRQIHKHAVQALSEKLCPLQEALTDAICQPEPNLSTVDSVLTKMSLVQKEIQYQTALQLIREKALLNEEQVPIFEDLLRACQNRTCMKVLGSRSCADSSRQSCQCR